MERLRREKEDLSEQQDAAAITSIVSGGVGAVCVIGGLLFPPLAVPAIALAGGAAGASVGSLAVAGIMETMKASEERLALMKEKIEEHRKRIASSQGKSNIKLIKKLHMYTRTNLQGRFVNLKKNARKKVKKESILKRQ